MRLRRPKVCSIFTRVCVKQFVYKAAALLGIAFTMGVNSTGEGEYPESPEKINL